MEAAQQFSVTTHTGATVPVVRFPDGEYYETINGTHWGPFTHEEMSDMYPGQIPAVV